MTLDNSDKGMLVLVNNNNHSLDNTEYYSLVHKSSELMVANNLQEN